MSASLQALVNARIRALLVGPPGSAKTARLAAVAAANDMRFVVMRASLSERIDFGGCLVPDMGAGLTRALPLDVLHDLRNTTKPTLLLLDDLGQAPMDVQAAIMKLFDEGELSPQVLICGATNRPGDKAAVTGLCEPLRSRFHVAYTMAMPGQSNDTVGTVTLGTWEEELSGWVNWALDAGMPAEVVAWHRSTTGRTLYQWKPDSNPAMRMPDYRSWQTVGSLWNAGLRDFSTISAAIGRPAAGEFLAFARLANSLPTPDQVFMDPNNAPVPTDMPALYLIATMLGAAAKPDNCDAVLTYMGRMNNVYAALTGVDMYRRLGAALSGKRSWVKWFTDNQELFGV